MVNESDPPILQKRPLTGLGVFWYTLANLGFGAFYAFNNFVIPLWLQAYTKNAVVLSLMAGTHSYEGALIQPLIGRLSDRLNSRLGRRAPFLLIFIPISAVFLLLAPLAAHLGVSIRLPAIVTCIFLFTLAFNVALDPYQAMMTDITTVEQRSRVSGIWYSVGALGQVVVLVLPIPLSTKFTLVGVLMLAMTLLTCLNTREPANTVLDHNSKTHHDGLKEALAGLSTLRQARKYLLVFLCYGMTMAAVMPNLSMFIKVITRCDDQHAQMMPLILMLVTAAASAPFGKLARRMGELRLFFCGIALVGVASLAGLWIMTLPQVAVIMVIAGLGTAAQNASAYPLLTRLVPNREIGFYIGLQTAALSLFAPTMTTLTGVLINQNGYRVMFAVCAAWVAIGLLILKTIRPAVAIDEINRREREADNIPLDYDNFETANVI